ncbi:DUF4159 domain-containing protein [Prosthecobacter dejongeii]|uniref:DUF4159 domain-containing protein n=1 Tax=Prosthecobacter dejongeii TaxID=48465 RepID=A0A7W8DND7_9BACT|nr:DUF4159 domain-containing protein [Prosthecobacter dejongeii]MBB5035990.1 hypothetical protein [Prosthecobacter dejongeii]
MKLLPAFFALAALGFCLAEDAPSPTNFGIKDGSVPEDPREAGRGGQFLDFPTWPVSKELPNDVFTFARLRYNSESWGRRRGGGKWTTDYPDADLNFSYRLQQLTSLQVSPKGAVVDIDAEQMRHYPFIYMIEPGHISLTDGDAKVMREYMLNGGFIMVDDFWGEEEWDTFYVALKQIFPDREPQELPLEHEVFHMVFPLKVKPQIPSVGHAMAGRSQGITAERFDAQTPHYRAIFDDKKRIVMMICHNTDLGDGWEEEGTDPWYFREFSEKYAYPLGINIVFYALTH